MKSMNAQNDLDLHLDFHQSLTRLALPRSGFFADSRPGSQENKND
jgi:hypothetical protein